MTQFRVSIATVYTYYITAKNEEEACDKAYQAFDKEDPLDYYDPTILGVETLHPGDFGYESENKKSVKKKPVKSRSQSSASSTARKSPQNPSTRGISRAVGKMLIPQPTKKKPTSKKGARK